MGFVPHTLEIFGKDYEYTSHHGLNEFTDELKKREKVLSTPVSYFFYKLNVPSL